MPLDLKMVSEIVVTAELQRALVAAMAALGRRG
jgi:hypothetical protein